MWHSLGPVRAWFLARMGRGAHGCVALALKLFVGLGILLQAELQQPAERFGSRIEALRPGLVKVLFGIILFGIKR